LLSTSHRAAQTTPFCLRKADRSLNPIPLHPIRATTTLSLGAQELHALGKMINPEAVKPELRIKSLRLLVIGINLDVFNQVGLTHFLYFSVKQRENLLNCSPFAYNL
jgi:hypothetical protein